MSDEASLRPRTAVVRADELRDWVDGAAMLEGARLQAASIRVDAETVREREARRGYEDGLARAAEATAGQLQAACGAAGAALDEIERALPGIVSDIVEDILGQFDLRDVMLPAVRRALAGLRRGSAATLRAAPDCVQAAETALRELPDAGIGIEVDPGLAAGRCLFESGLGRVELGLEAQLRVLRETMAERWRETA